MTKVFDHSSPSHSNVLDGAVREIIPNSTSPFQGITIATIVKAVRAFVLSQVSGCSDVVFGVTTWGRNAPGSENVMGSCMDTIPMRVHLQSGMLPLALLTLVQQQTIASLPHEMFGYQRIVDLCTNWRPWERLSSILLYQNLDEDIEAFSLGESHIQVNELRSQSDRADLAVYSRPHGEGIWLEINYNESLIPAKFACALLNSLVSAVQVLGDLSSTTLAPHCLGFRIPLNIETKRTPAAPHFETFETIDDELYEEVQEAVAEAWSRCFKRGIRTDIKDMDKSVPFFEIWGSPLAAYSLMISYRGRGIQVDVEDIFNHPTEELQEQFLYKILCNRNSLTDRLERGEDGVSSRVR
jgi:hypothetical protein